ncbi:MAG: bis(5'-nucleosyl)-tetraphosphatase (symmetrical) [Paraglaciecola sp.]|jgi:bis(5'-nucleosyl)-tetraphosphatase (symmetrical)
MADYVVGDIQGCLSGLKTLLAKVNFDPQVDKLWSVGDMVARGPESLQTLHYLYDLGDSFETVLGNHDLHLLAIYCGFKTAKPEDKLDELVNAPDFPKFIHWLRTKSLALRIDQNTLLCHAGLYPRWSMQKAIDLSHEVCEQLRGDNWPALIAGMYANTPTRWTKDLQGLPRWRFIVNALTRMRFIEKNNHLELNCNLSPQKAPQSLTPWFTIANKKLLPQQKVLFGHWAALKGATHCAQFIGLDTGYVWGGNLTLYNLSSGKIVSSAAN